MVRVDPAGNAVSTALGAVAPPAGLAIAYDTSIGNGVDDSGFAALPLRTGTAECPAELLPTSNPPYFLGTGTTWDGPSRKLTVTNEASTFACFGNVQGDNGQYHVILNYTKTAGSQLAIRNSGWTSGALAASGTLDFTYTNSDAGGLCLQASGGNFSGTISIVSVKKVVGDAKRFFVNPATGSDSNSIAQAQNPATPLATADKALTYADRYRGDQVLVAEGSTFAASFPNLDNCQGFDPTYPFVVQSYDPADPLNEAKYGRAKNGARPIFNTNVPGTLSVTGASTYPARWVAIRGFDFNPGNVGDQGFNIISSNNLPNQYFLIENNLFRFTTLVLNQIDDGSSINFIVRNNSFYGQWSPTAHAQGLFIAGMDNMTVEDNVFWHVGWKVDGAGRDDASEGATIYRHSIYWQDNGGKAVIRRNLMMDPSATGLSGRSHCDAYENVCIRCPIALIAGPGDNYDVVKPLGIDVNYYHNAILESVPISTSAGPRSDGLTSGNAKIGSAFHHNLLARSNATPNGSGVVVQASKPQPSCMDAHHNVDFQWSSTWKDGSSDVSPPQVLLTSSRNYGTPGSGTELDIAGFTTPNPYTADQLFVAMGYANERAAANYWIEHPETFPAREAWNLLWAGYGMNALPVLDDLAFNALSLRKGIPASGVITGAWPKQPISVSSLPGLTVDPVTHAWSYDGSDYGAAAIITFTQTMGDLTHLNTQDLTPQALSPDAAATPLAVWYDPSDLSTLFQDTTGTTPVTASGQTVALMKDKSANGYHMLQATAGNRPVYQANSGQPYLDFSGGKTMQTSGTGTLTDASGYHSTGMAVRLNSTVGGGLMFTADGINGGPRLAQMLNLDADGTTRTIAFDTGGGNWQETGPKVTATGPTVLTEITNNKSIEVFLNGVGNGAVTAGPATYQTGAVGLMLTSINGGFAGAAMFKGALSTSDHAGFVNYLNGKM